MKILNMLSEFKAMPHATLRDKVLFFLCVMGVAFFSLLNPIASVISYFMVNMAMDLPDSSINVALWLLLSIPVYLWLLSINYYYLWVKLCNSPFRVFLHNIFLSQVVYIFFIPIWFKWFSEDPISMLVAVFGIFPFGVYLLMLLGGLVILTLTSLRIFKFLAKSNQNQIVTRR